MQHKCYGNARTVVMLRTWPSACSSATTSSATALSHTALMHNDTPAIASERLRSHRPAYCRVADTCVATQLGLFLVSSALILNS